MWTDFDELSGAHCFWDCWAGHCGDGSSGGGMKNVMKWFDDSLDDIGYQKGGLESIPKSLEDGGHLIHTQAWWHKVRVSW